MSEEKKLPIKVAKKSKKIKIKAKGTKLKIKKPSIKDCSVLEEKYSNIKTNDIDLTNLEHQNLLKCIDNKNRSELADSSQINFLYPTLNDPNFNSKIASKKEF